MRILGLAHHSWPGLTPVSGADVYTSQLLEYLAAKGHDVTVAVLGSKKTTVQQNGTTVHMRRGAIGCEDLVRGNDIIVTYLGATVWAKKFGKQHGIPVVQTIHNTSKYTAGFLGSGCDLAVYNSAWIQKSHDITRQSKIIYDWKGDGHAIATNRTISDWPWMICRPPALLRPELYGNKHGKITLINALPNKGADIFYALAASMSEREFRVVHGGYEQTKEVVRRLPNVEFVPHQADLTDVYEGTSVLLMPSVYESYGMVAVEAMSYGIPVVASSTAGLQECMGSLVTYERTLEAFQGALEATLRDYDLRSSMASIRYRELHKQTKSDLEEFEQAMIEVASGADYSQPARGNTRV